MNSGTTPSTDGTSIAWSVRGSGPPLVMVHCVASSRNSTPQQTLPDVLAAHFTVFTYDRRGTGESGTAESYVVEREFEDLTAVIALTDGPADVYGFSSGATLAMLAAIGGVPVRRLALMEPPLISDADPGGELRAEAQRRVDHDLADARRWFDREVVGIPEEVLAQFPPWTDQQLRNTATIVHEMTFLPGTTPERFHAVPVPTLLLASDHTDPEMLEWADQLEHVISHSVRRVLPGQWHGVDDATLTTAIVDFLDPSP